MTPEQIKAKELVDKFIDILLKKELRAHGSFINDCAKECAIIAINEIMPATWKLSTYKKWGLRVDEITTTEFWKQVLLEIPNI